jgi:multidrug efflux system outer membrane protein
VAKALRLPAITLTGALGVQSEDVSDLAGHDALIGGLAAGIVSPLFNFGKNDARVEIERARTEQAVQSYLGVFIQALREVEDSLVGVRTWREEYAALARQVASARAAAVLSRARYDGGLVAYLEVLDAERSLFDAELKASEALRERLTSVVSLYKALGGGWNPETPPAPKKP